MAPELSKPRRWRRHNGETLRSFSQSPTPILWPAAQFYNTAKSDQDSLHDARVIHATSYYEPGAVGHDYIVLGIDPNTGNPRDRFWLRCQRTPGAYDRGANIPTFRELLRANRKFPAVDTIAFSFDESQLRSTNDAVISLSAFENVQVRHLSSILESVYSVSPSYDLLSCNSWWFAGVILRTLHLHENQNNRRPSMWKRLTMAFGPGTAQEDHKVAKRFFEHIDSGVNTPVHPLPTSEPSGGSFSGAATENFASPRDVGADISVASTSTIDPFVSIVRTLRVLDCPVTTLCGLIQTNPATGKGLVDCLVRWRSTVGVKRDFILFRVSDLPMTHMWIRLERGARARVGPVSITNTHSNIPTNDISKVSEKQSSLLTDDHSYIAAIVEFRDPPTLDTLSRLLTVISQESKVDIDAKENPWFYASIIQEVLTNWCSGNLHGTLSHLTSGKDARDQIRARKDYIMGLPPDAA